MIVDVHSHIATHDLLAAIDKIPNFQGLLARDAKGAWQMRGYGPLDPPVYDLEPRIASLERRKVDKQLVGTFNPLLNWTGGAPDAAFARFVNQETAKAVAPAKGRLIGMATIAFGEPDQAAAELERAIDAHGFPGAHLGIAAGTKYLDDPAFDPLWRVCERRNLFLYMHPARDHAYAKCRDYTLNTIVFYPTETCITVARMIFAGVFERFPGLNLCLAHGGGTLPYLAARLDRAYDAPKYERNPAHFEHISRRPSEYIKRINVDTCVFGAEQLDFLLGFLGPERLMFGTDYPFEIGDAEGACAAPWLARQIPQVKAKIEGANAAAILDRPH